MEVEFNEDKIPSKFIKNQRKVEITKFELVLLITIGKFLGEFKCQEIELKFEMRIKETRWCFKYFLFIVTTREDNVNWKLSLNYKDNYKTKTWAYFFVFYEAKVLNESLGFFPARKSIFVESYKLKIYEKDNLTKTKEIFILIFSIKFSPKFIL